MPLIEMLTVFINDMSYATIKLHKSIFRLFQQVHVRINSMISNLLSSSLLSTQQTKNFSMMKSLLTETDAKGK